MPTPPLPTRVVDAPEIGPICVLTLEQGDRPVVVIDESLLERLDRTLDSVPRGLAGFVLESSAPRSFVAGADLKSIMSMDDQALHAYLRFGAAVFMRITNLPCPTAAAIGGACLGGGFELAAHCDGLIGLVDPDSKPYPIGLPEAGLKICPGWGGSNLLPARIDPETAIVATATGRPFNAESANELGMFDATCDNRDRLVETAIAWIGAQRGHTDRGTPMRWIGADSSLPDCERGLEKARGTLEPSLEGDAVLECVHVGLTEGWQAACEKERTELVRLRHTEPATAAIESFFARSAKPKATS